MLKRKSIYVLVITFILFSSSSSFSEGKYLSLEESIDFALKHNQTILIAQEELKKSQAKITKAQASIFPNLTVNAVYTHLGEIPSISFAGQSFGFSEEDTYSGGLGLQQLLYTGGKVKGAREIAKLYADFAKENLEEKKQKVIFEVKKSFYTILLAKQLVKINEESVAQLKRHLATIQERYKAGIVPEFDLLRAKVELANAEPKLIKARNSLILGEENFKRILGLNLAISIKLVGDIDYTSLKVKHEESLAKALKERPEIKKLKLNKEMDKKNTAIAKSGYKPSLYLSGDYGYKKGTLGFEDWEDSWSMMLIFQFPLFDGGKTKASLKEAKISSQQTSFALEQLKEAIKVEIHKAYLDLQEAEEVINSQGQSVEQSSKSLRIAEARYKEGLLTHLELLSTQLSLTQARTNYAQSLYKHLVAKAELVRVMGEKE